MKALQLKSIGKIGMEILPIPEPRKGQVLLKISSSSLCRTDAKMWKVGHRDLVLPRVLGHEFCGTIVDTGKRYVVWPGSACGQCEWCRNEYENLCDQMQIIGFHKDGGLAEYAVVPERSLLPVPDDLSDELACMAEPLACTINALKMAGVQKGQKILIYGAGPVGLMMALAVQAKEAQPTVCEINPRKIEISRNFQKKTGITVTKQLTRNKWDTVINAAPSLDTFMEGIKKLKSAGCFCIFSGFINDSGFTTKEIIGVLNEIHYRQLRISSAYGCTRQQIRLSLDLLQNQADKLSLLIKKTISIENVPEVLPKIWAGETMKYIVKIT